VAAARRLGAGAGPLIVQCGLEAKIFDTEGHLDLPPDHAFAEFILAGRAHRPRTRTDRDRRPPRVRAPRSSRRDAPRGRARRRASPSIQPQRPARRVKRRSCAGASGGEIRVRGAAARRAVRRGPSR
jgi:hypothetical protein